MARPRPLHSEVELLVGSSVLPGQGDEAPAGALSTSPGLCISQISIQGSAHCLLIREADHTILLLCLLCLPRTYAARVPFI